MATTSVPVKVLASIEREVIREFVCPISRKVASSWQEFRRNFAAIEAQTSPVPSPEEVQLFMRGGNITLSLSFLPMDGSVMSLELTVPLTMKHLSAKPGYADRIHHRLEIGDEKAVELSIDDALHRHRRFSEADSIKRIPGRVSRSKTIRSGTSRTLIQEVSHTVPLILM